MFFSGITRTAILWKYLSVPRSNLQKCISWRGSSLVLPTPLAPSNRLYSSNVALEYYVTVPLNSLLTRYRQLMTSAVDFENNSSGKNSSNEKNIKTMDSVEWAKRLTPEQYSICRLSGTEPPFLGKFYDHWEPGTYSCVCCGTALFSSESKFDSGSGWPSFSTVIGSNVTEQKDLTHGMNRTEVRCSSCKGHLGHLFDDGPPPTGKRYCINSICLSFAPK